MDPVQFETLVADFGNREGMFDDGTILVALSGGGDSVCLLHVLTRIAERLGFKVAAAHLNHGIRDGASDDERFCRKLCARLGIPFLAETLAPGDLLNTGESLETAARNIRLEFLEHAASETGATRIATGHTRDDLAETVLLRLMRGTGPEGASGILPIRDGRWVRPLLCMTRHETRAYLDRLGEPYRHDESNGDPAFTRNRVRHELIPLMENRFNPRTAEALARFAELNRTQESYLTEQVSAAFAGCLIHADSAKILLDKRVLMGYHVLLQQRIVRRCLMHLEGSGRTTDRAETDDILRTLLLERGTITVTERVRFEATPNIGTFAITQHPFDPVPISESGVTPLPNGCGAFISDRTLSREPGDGPMDLVLDRTALSHHGTLSVGTARPGETLVPSWKEHPVKIRDLYSSAGVPRILRTVLPVVRAGETAIWIPGIARSRMTAGSADDTGSRDLLHLRYRGGINWM